MNSEKSAADWFARMHGPDAAGTREAFERWYADPANARAYDHLARTWDQAMFLANTPTGRSRNLALASARGGRRRLAIALCASVLLALILAIAIGGRRAPSGSGPAGRMTATAAAGPNGIRTIALPDGSRVTLDRSSRLDIAFTGAERRLRLLGGRARFDVAHDAARPFIVEAGGGSVIAHGTMFDVTVAPRHVEVVLLRGAVEVRDGSPGGTPRHVRRLVPGQKVALLEDGITAPVTVAAADLGWPRAMIEFDGVPLGDAVAAFNRTGGHAIVVEDAGARALRVTGAFRRDDPEGFAATLAATFGLNVRREPDARLSLVGAPSAAAAKKP